MNKIGLITSCIIKAATQTGTVLKNLINEQTEALKKNTGFKSKPVNIISPYFIDRLKIVAHRQGNIGIVHERVSDQEWHRGQSGQLIQISGQYKQDRYKHHYNACSHRTLICASLEK